METICARTPVRIDLAGGTLDIWPLHLALPEPAVTVNAALDLPARADVTLAPPGDTTIRLQSADQERSVAYAHRDALQDALRHGACPLALLGEAVCASEPAGGLTLHTSSRAPAGSGLGGSSALLCAALAALLEAHGRRPAARALQTLAQDVETRVLRMPTGYQDYFPPLFGGCLALEGGVGGVRVERLPVDLDGLGRRLRLVYTGAPHVSGITNWAVVRAYLDGERTTVDALGELASIARGLRARLRAGDVDGALDLVIQDGRVRRRMAPGVTTPAIEALDAAARAAGARGSKVLGAGGGGCVLLVLEDEGAGPAVDALIAAGPGRALALRLVDEGLVVERTAAGA